MHRWRYKHFLEVWRNPGAGELAALVIKRCLTTAAPALALAGCVPGHGDRFINLYETRTNVAIKFADGSVATREVLPCDLNYVVGHDGLPWERFGEVVREVKITRPGETPHRLDAGQMKQLLAQKKGYWRPVAWGVGPGGLRLVTDFDTPAPECAGSALSLFPSELRVDAVEEELAGEMALIPAGAFQMGDLSGAGWSDEKPVHTVTAPAFRLGKYEASLVQWAACMADGECQKKRTDRYQPGRPRPVLDMSWDEAQDRRRVPVADGSGMGIRGPGRRDDGILLGR